MKLIYHILLESLVHATLGTIKIRIELVFEPVPCAASVRYILDNIPNLKFKKILLFGAGKIGRNTCENLVKHTSNKHITLINRSW